MANRDDQSVALWNLRLGGLHANRFSLNLESSFIIAWYLMFYRAHAHEKFTGRPGMKCYDRSNETLWRELPESRGKRKLKRQLQKNRKGRLKQRLFASTRWTEASVSFFDFHFDCSYIHSCCFCRIVFDGLFVPFVLGSLQNMCIIICEESHQSRL